MRIFDSVFVALFAVALLGGCAAPEHQRQADSEESADAPTQSAVLADHERIIQISAGGDHVCARAASGHVYCWGKNALGQLGDGSTEDRLRPVMVEGITDAVDISAGGGHSCAVHEDGTVSCWGLDSHGQLGNGGSQRRRGQELFNKPAKVVRVGAATDKQLEPQSRYGGGRVYCAGGELEDIVQVEAGVRHTCALHDSGAVLCWGENDNGGGLGTMWERDGVHCPMPVWNVEKASELAAASNTTCAVLEDGAVRCWGSHSFSMMSDFTGENVPNPYSRMVEMRDLDDALTIAMGAKHICAVRDSGELACWGSNFHQSLRPSSQRQIPDPLTIEELDEVIDADSAGAQQCVVRKDGSVFCWGSDKGKVQPGGRPQQTAVEIPGLEGITRVRLGGYAHLSESGYSIGVEGGYGCALDRRGRVQCWGNNGLHLGDGSQEGRSEPRPVDFSEAFETASNVEADDEPTPSFGQGGEADDEDTCPAEKSVGDSSSPNSLTFQFEDRQRTFYFDRAVAELQNTTLVITFPGVELQYEGEDSPSRSWSPRIGIELTKGSPTEQTHQPRPAHTLGGPDVEGWDCMGFLPRQHGTSTLRRYLPPKTRHGDGLVEGEFSLYAGSPELGAIKGRFRVRDFVRTPRSEHAMSSGNAFLHDGAMQTASNLQVTYKPESEVLSIQMGASKSGRSRKKHFVLSDFDGKTGTYENYRDIFVVEEFAAGVARGKIYRMQVVGDDTSDGFDLNRPSMERQRARNSTDEIGGFFDEARSSENSQPEREKVLVATFSTDRVFTRPQLGSVTQTMPPLQNDGRGKSRDDGKQPDTVFELSAPKPLKLAVPPEPARVIFESRRSDTNSAVDWQDRARGWGGWQVREVGDAQDSALQFTFKMRGSRRLPDPATIELDAGSFMPRRHIRELPAVYSLRHLDTVDDDLKALADERGNLRDPVTLTTEFGDGQVELTAENRVQGRDTFTLDVPEHTFHESQLIALVEHLPLEPGYTTEFYVLSMRTQSLGFGKGTRINPQVDKVELAVIGEKAIETVSRAEPVDTWMVRFGKYIAYVDNDGHVVAFRHGRSHFDRELRTTP